MKRLRAAMLRTASHGAMVAAVADGRLPATVSLHRKRLLQAFAAPFVAAGQRDAMRMRTPRTRAEAKAAADRFAGMAGRGMQEPPAEMPAERLEQREPNTTAPREPDP